MSNTPQWVPRPEDQSGQAQPGAQWGQQPGQPQPGWGQQPPAAPKKSGKAKAGCFGCLGVLGLIAVVVVIASAASSGGSKTTSPAASPAASVTGKAAGAPASKAPASKPKTVLTASGTGIKNTAQFTVGDTWTLHWTVDCAAFGSAGNLIVSDETGMPLVNELKKKGSGSSPQYTGGTHHLQVNSECAWTVKVVNG